MTKQRMKMKRENNDDGPHDNKRSRRNEDEDSVRILIPSNIAGAIIGKGGMHIQKMRSQYKATVSVDDSQGPERTIMIAADLESILQIISEMLKYFEEVSYTSSADFRLLIHQSLAGCIIGKGGQKIKEIRDKIGCRILKVFSNFAPQSTDRVVQIIGTQSQIVEAVREIITLTKDTPIKGHIHYYNPINFHLLDAEEYGGYSGAGTTRPSQRGGGGSGGGSGGGRGGGGFNDRRGGDRDGPRGGRGNDGGGRNSFINPWSNDFGANNSGGGGGFGGNNFGSGGGGGFGGSNFGPDNNSGGFGGGPNLPNGNFNNGGGFGGNSGGNLGGNFGGGSGGFGNNIGGGPLGGNQGNFGGNRGFNGPNLGNGMGPGNGPNFGGSGSSLLTSNATLTNLPVGHDPENSTQVTIPKDLAGAIIGKGGGRIRRIRNESNAYITIDEPLPGSNDRIITISGTPKQIQMAQYLLQKSAHENNTRRNF